jgi:hypothetical protein
VLFGVDSRIDSARANVARSSNLETGTILQGCILTQKLKLSGG